MATGFGLDFGFNFGLSTSSQIFTFADLIANSESQKITLLELQLAEDISSLTWTQEASPNTNAWSLSYLKETIALTTGYNSIINKVVTSMVADGVTLTLVNSISSVHSTSNSYWQDTINGIVYVNVGGNPSSQITNLIASFTLYQATSGVVLNGNYYEPYIISAPTISQRTDNILSGFSVIGGGTVSLINTDGFWNRIFDKFLWENRNAILRFGGELLPIGEYEQVFTGIIFNKSWSEKTVSLDIRDNQMSLLRALPETLFNSTNNPNADTNILGLPVPIAYGFFGQDDLASDTGGRTAQRLRAEDESLKSDANGNLVTFTIADHTIFSGDALWASPDNGGTWFLMTAQSPSTDAPDTAGKWGSLDDVGVIGDSSNNSTVTVKFAVDGSAGTSASTIPYVPQQTIVKFAFKGRENSDGTHMTSVSDVINDLLTIFNGFTSADIDTTSFATSKLGSSISFGIPIGYSGNVKRVDAIIEKIAITDFAFFFVNKLGEFDYHVFNAIISSDSPNLDRSELLEYEVEYTQDEMFSKLRIGYLQSSTNQNYLYDFQEDTPSQNKYLRLNQKTINTYLDNAVDARELSSRQLLIRKAPRVLISGKCKWQLSQLDVGGNFSITSSRSPIDNSTGWSERTFQLLEISKDLNTGTISFVGEDLTALVSGVGAWTSDTAPNWATATDAEKASSGFWTEDTGLIDSTDISSNQSTYF